MAVSDSSNRVSTCPKNTTTTAPINAMPRSSRQRPQQYNSHRNKERLDGATCSVEEWSSFDTVDMNGTSCAAEDVAELIRFRHTNGATLR
jgi:hypothetical protein